MRATGSGGSRGFTLIEVLIAVAIFATAIGGVLALLAAGVASRRRAEDGVEAALIAESLAAEARARFRQSGRLVPVGDATWPARPLYRYDIDYIPLDETGDEMLMQIRVHWLRRGRATAYIFNTVLLRKTD